MAITIVKLGSPRKAKEGLRIGTVRRPPRGVPKSEYAKRDFYDVWLPNLAPSSKLLREAKAAHDKKSWAAFARKFRSEMHAPDAGKILDLLAALFHQTRTHLINRIGVPLLSLLPDSFRYLVIQNDIA